MKRAFSLLLALVMLLLLAPTTIAANDKAPYSLQYLKDIEGVQYVKYTELDESDHLKNTTIEVYDVIDLWMKSNSSWASIVRPFRDAFKNAGFTETIAEDTDEFDNQPQYMFQRKEGAFIEGFVIYSEKRSHSILNESAIVYIHHASTIAEDSQDNEQDEEELEVPKTTILAGFNNFQKRASYTEGRFSDVKSDYWFANGIQAAYELGLMSGDSKTTFNPNGDMTIAEALAIACRLHSIYYGENSSFSGGNPWYQPYVDYAVQKGFIKNGEYSDYTKKATRANFANITYAALPAETWTSINNISKLPDVHSSDWFGTPVFALYNAGVLKGNDKYGTFNPNNTIKRSEIATIVTRVAVPSTRVRFSLQDAPIYPQSISMNEGGGLYIGAKHQFTVTFSPETTNARGITWSSSNNNAATVSENGLVTAVSVGKAIITATAANGVSVSREINVLKRDSVKIVAVVSDMNSVGGVQPHIYWRNDSGKTIKYITFVATPYNAVGDKASSDIGNETTQRLKVTGPIEPFQVREYGSVWQETYFYIGKKVFGREYTWLQPPDELGYFFYEYPDHKDTNKKKVYVNDSNYDILFDRHDEWDPIWYNYSIRKVQIDKVEIEFMDGTKETIKNPSGIDYKAGFKEYVDLM